ncbi:MAG: terpene cyclase/mutase family protein [Isosphaeraceae bacterium]
MTGRRWGWGAGVGLVAAFWVGAGTLARGEEKAPRQAANSPDEPMATGLSLGKAARFLDDVSLDWTRRRKCGTCHTNYAYMIARPAVKGEDESALKEVRAFFESRVAGWETGGKDAKPRGDSEVVATAVVLALQDAQTTGTLHPLTRKALDAMWPAQEKNGAWEWPKCDWPPYEHDDYYGAVFAALGVGLAPEDYQRGESARAGLERLRGYLRETKAPSLHHRAMLLWASMKTDGLLTVDERRKTVDELLSRQRPDGGWNLASLGNWTRQDGSPNDPEGPGDGFGTGFVVYVLRQAGVGAEHEAVQRGVDWLKGHQRVSGRWFTRSPTVDKAHYITHAGTGFAVLALRACGVEDR